MCITWTNSTVNGSWSQVVHRALVKRLSNALHTLAQQLLLPHDQPQLIYRRQTCLSRRMSAPPREQQRLSRRPLIVSVAWTSWSTSSVVHLPRLEECLHSATRTGSATSTRTCSPLYAWTGDCCHRWWNRGLA